MEPQKKKKFLFITLGVLVVLLVGIIISPRSVHHESIQEAMRDAVLHTENKVDLLGLAVNPSLISAFTRSIFFRPQIINKEYLATLLPYM